MNSSRIVLSLLVTGVLASPLAHATNGYQPIAYGAKNEAMGGASIALPLDSLAAANNPAGMVMVGDRIDFGLIWFKPDRSTTVSGNDCSNVSPVGPGCTMDGTYSGNGRSYFFIPSFGYNKMINADTAIGVSVFGNGGMNTAYDTNLLAPFGGSGPMGINLAQLFIAPTWSMKINPTNSVGVALNLAYQMFSATGLQPFACPTFGPCGPGGSPSTSPANVTNNGTDTSTGYGVRIGWTGQVTPTVTLGATYQSKTKMGKLSKYSGLFAEQGGFDVPSNYGVGIAVKAMPETTVAFDFQRINYGDVASVGNPLVLPTNLGANSGAGFGWQNINVYKIGVSHAYSSGFTVRAGYDHCDQPIPNSQTFFNTLAPGVVQDHLSLGGTWTLADKSEISVAYVHAFSKTVNGPGAIPGVPGDPFPTGGFGGGDANLTMHEDSISISYGW
jgi:long-chain fatty acid transport protein